MSSIGINLNDAGSIGSGDWGGFNFTPELFSSTTNRNYYTPTGSTPSSTAGSYSDGSQDLFKVSRVMNAPGYNPNGSRISDNTDPMAWFPQNYNPSTGFGYRPGITESSFSGGNTGSNRNRNVKVTYDEPTYSGGSYNTIPGVLAGGYQSPYAQAYSGSGRPTPAYDFGDTPGERYDKLFGQGFSNPTMASSGRKSAAPTPWTQSFAKQSEWSNYTPEQKSILLDMSDRKGSLQPPVSEQNLRNIAMQRYDRFTPEMNKAGIQRVSDLEGYNAMRGNMGFWGGLAELGGRLVNEVPLIGNMTRKAGLSGGRLLTGQNPFSRALRTGFDVAGVAGGPGFNILGLGAGALSDYIGDTYYPNKPIAGLTGTENLQRAKLVNGQVYDEQGNPFAKSFWED